MVAWTFVGHIFGLGLCMAGLIMTTAVLVQHSQETSPEVLRTLARMGRICLRGLADPGAFLTLLAGIILVAANRAHYLHARWLHIKLVFVAVLIGVNGIVAISNKSLVSGRANFQSSHLDPISGNAASGTDTRGPDVLGACDIILQLPPATSANSGAIRAMGNPPVPRIDTPYERAGRRH
jgi:uncharacterized membrane protein